MSQGVEQSGAGGSLGEQLEELARGVYETLGWADSARTVEEDRGACGDCRGRGCDKCRGIGRDVSSHVDPEKQAKVLEQLGPSFEKTQRDVGRLLAGGPLPGDVRHHLELAELYLRTAKFNADRGDYDDMDRVASAAMSHLSQARNTALGRTLMDIAKTGEERMSSMADGTEGLQIPVTQVRLNLVDVPGPTKAIGSVNLGGCFMVHGVRVVESPNGLFVGMPQRKDGDQYRDLAHPLTADLRARMNSAVLEEYQRLRDREGPERTR